MFPDKNGVWVVMETGNHSLWISRLVKKLGIEVLVAHVHDLKLIYASGKIAKEKSGVAVARKLVT